MTDSQPGTRTHRRSRAALIVTLALIAILLLAGIGAAVWWIDFTHSPAYSIGQLAEAVQRRDWDGVQKYVDIDSVVRHAVDAAVSKAVKQDTTGLGALAAGIVKSTKADLVAQAKLTLRQGVEQGQSTLATDSISSVGFFAINQVKSVTYVGDEALVTVEVPLARGKPLELKLRMKRVGDHWRVIAIDNILDLLGSAAGPVQNGAAK
jgi:hypothetical protein